MNFVQPILKYFSLVLTIFIFFQYSNSFSQKIEPSVLDTIRAGKFDTGRMWLFEYPPTEYFKEEYGFEPDKKWYDEVRLATLKFADYCTASFVSEDGLIMTNHHCARESVSEIIDENDDFHKNGFIAWTLEDEIPVPGLFVEQCIAIEDVTEEIHEAIETAESDSEKLQIKSEKIKEIENKYQNDEENYAQVVSLYSGSLYSLYFYKRYNDVRLVFAPEDQAGYFGGDYDNFTYPRYNFDCSFFRVYDEDGNPLKVENYFKWSKNGAQPGEVVFVTGNPGSTSRLKTVAQLEYERDILIPQTLEILDSFIEIVENMMKEEQGNGRLNDQLLEYYNSRKAYKGILDGLKNPILMQRKKDFENNFREKVLSNSVLKNEVGDPWSEIEVLMTDLKKLSNERIALTYNSFDSPEYFFITQQVLDIAEELKLPEPERSEIYTVDNLEKTIESLLPEDFNYEMNDELLKQKIDLLYKTFGEDDEIIQQFTNGKKGDEAVEDILSRSSLTSIKKIKQLINSDPDEIINSDDPFIQYIHNADKRDEMISDQADKILTSEEICNRKLGKALFEVYGTLIPPDATFNLRFSDGIVKGFAYNGTEAPPLTTFYGMLDRYYSYDGNFSWHLHDCWLNASSEFDLSTPFNFVTTNDVVGGNSGSPVINKDAEVVGVSFDGNIQSLPGDFIYDEEVNRMVGLHSAGMLEAIKDLYKFERLAKELKTGKNSNINNGE